MSYYILARYYYYQNALGKPQDGLMRDKDGYLLEFASEEEAQEYIDALEEGVYVLAHGEYASPSYEVVSPVSWGDDCYQADGDELQPDYAPVAEQEVPEEIRKTLLAANVEYVRGAEGYDIYAAYEGDYAIIYCPSASALDYYADDLGDLDWRNYHFAKLDYEDGEDGEDGE